MSDENPGLLDALLSVRTAEPPAMAGVAGETRKWEQKGDTLTLEAKAPTEPGDAKVEDWLVERGYDPDLWVATGFRSSEWTMANGETGVSVRYTFTKAPEGREQVDIDELLAIVNEARPGRLAAQQPTSGPGFVLALGDSQFGKADKDGPEGAVRQTLDCIDRAVESLVRYQSTAVVPVSHAHIAWLGDHIEGFVSQGGANAWRTTLTLSEQVRLTRRVMLYAVQRFAPLVGRLTVVAVPGNHGEPQRFAGKGVTRYDDSHDTEALHAVADACQMNPGAYGHVEFYTPAADELTVVVEVAGTYLAHVHGDQWGAGKHFNWWQGQAFGAEVGLQHCDMLLAGHWHHLKLEQSGGRLYVQVPALESESTWWRHRTGIGGNPGALVMLVSEGSLLGVEVV